MSKIPRDLIPVNDAAAQRGYHHRTVRTWIRTGKLPAYRMAGYRVFVSQADLDKLLQPVPTAKSA